MSSFLGGKGSLRGACTQPCRRAYTSAKKKGFFFSPTDLDTSELMGRLRQIPLAALKIEGRMKGAEYVSRVVKAYRMLLDAPLEDLDEVLPEAAKLIEASMGRQRSTGFLLSAQPPFRSVAAPGGHLRSLYGQGGGRPNRRWADHLAAGFDHRRPLAGQLQG